MNRKSHLTLELAGLTETGVGEHGISETEIDQIAAPAAAAVEQMDDLRRRGEVGFFDLPDDRAGARAVMDFVREVPAQIDTVAVLGIGGSSLGPQALYSALGPAFDIARPRAPGLPRRLFFPDNPDPVTFRALFEVCPPERTLYCVITKSGATAETAAQLMIVLDRIEQTLGAAAIPRHLVAITDPARGALRRVAQDLSLPSFSIPPAVGGRFSVLSPVGLVPAALAGLDVIGLLDGARRMRDRVAAGGDCRDVRRNPALLLAALLYLHDARRRRPMVVMMPYADSLASTADWFRQLWAESLGKERDVDGAVVCTGPTPIAARGATDQHSQLQLFAEGPRDKVFLLLGVRERGVEITMPVGRLAALPEYAYLAGRGLGELLNAELRGTLASLRRRGRPSALFWLDRVAAAPLGELLMLLQAACAFAGPLYRVNPFDQPGVEEAKRLAYAALGRPGYQEAARELDGGRGEESRYVL